MRWFFILFGTVTAVLFLSFVAWIVTRVMHAEQANYVIGRIMVYDLYAVGAVMAYSAFVGGWHLWEKLTGRMESEAGASRGGAEAVSGAGSVRADGDARDGRVRRTEEA